MIKKTSKIKLSNALPRYIPVVDMPDSDSVFITLMENRILSYELFVKEGDNVKVGTLLGEKKGPYFVEKIHSTVSGTVGKIVKKFIYSGKKVDTLEIINDKLYEYADHVYKRKYAEIENFTKEDIIEIVKENGIKGLSGSGFPSYIKLQTDKNINMIVLNGVECEPYLAADKQLIVNDSYHIFRGLQFIMKCLDVEKAVIGVKKTKQMLLDALHEAKEKDFKDLDCDIVPVGDYYPQGWEVELIKNATGIVVESGKIPADYGIVEFNVTTAKAVYNAVRFNKPTSKRYFTVQGTGIKNQCLLEVRVGTPIKDIIEAAGGYSFEGDKVLVMGGPMMGNCLVMDDAVVSKTTTSLLVMAPEEYKEEPCVRCGSCVYSCPVKIQPVQIMNAVKTKDADAIKALGVKKCIECGLCSYVCTSKIHLTDFMRKAKKLAK